MDAATFGAFLAARRKELGLTQAQLAQRLNVTDKAVSRWERGSGFPDIATLEPLAEALELSLLELMRSEHLPPSEATQPNEAALADTLRLAQLEQQLRRQRLRQSLLLALLGAVSVGAGIYLKWFRGDGVIIGGADGATAVFIVGKPLGPQPWMVCLLLGVVLLGAAAVRGWRKKG